MKRVIEISEEFYDGLMDESYDSIRSIPLEYTILVKKINNSKPLDDILDNIRKLAKFHSTEVVYDDGTLSDDRMISLSDLDNILCKILEEDNELQEKEI